MQDKENSQKIKSTSPLFEYTKTSVAYKIIVTCIGTNQPYYLKNLFLQVSNKSHLNSQTFMANRNLHSHQQFEHFISFL